MNKQNPLDVLWERLRAAAPQEVAARASVAYDAEQQAYRVPLIGTPLRVLPDAKRIDAPDGPAPFDLALVCVQYLLTAESVRLAGEWADPRSLGYGDFFFRPPHELPTAKLEGVFGQRVEAFRAAAEALGGRPLAMGDAASEFRVLPRVPIAVLLWAADEEFSARAQFLFDKTADRQLPIDALWMLTLILARRLAAVGGSS